MNKDPFILKGDKYGNEYNFFQVYLPRCTNTGCKNDTEQSNYFIFKNAEIYTVNSYYDGSDPDNPIKQYIKYHDKVEFNRYMYTTSSFKISPTKVNFLNGTSTVVMETELFDKTQW